MAAARPSHVRKLLPCTIIAVLLAGCSTTAKAPVSGRGVYRSHPPSHYTVRKGDTLYAIAWQYGLDYKDVAAWNGIRAPYLIRPGDRLRMRPGRWSHTAIASRSQRYASTPRTRAAGSHPAGSIAHSHFNRTTRSAPGAAPVKKSPSHAAKELTWSWPAKGRVIASFDARINKGVDIAGELGQPVYAARAGRVVYTGSGLIGYGKLIIVKHDKNYLSAYAHNYRLLVKEGDHVTGGQRIAQMGRTGATQVKLHFEIRRDGKPVDPLGYLPKG